MIAVIFEVYPTQEGMEHYLKIAGELKEHLSAFPGLISVERFQSLADKSKLLSLSFWEDESSVADWRKFTDHRLAQQKGKNELFSHYTIRVCSLVRDYSDTLRNEAPEDSNIFLLNIKRSLKWKTKKL